MAVSSMRDIKRRIRSVTSIEHITHAMKLVSTAKLRRAKLELEKKQGFLDYVTDNIDEICAISGELPSHYLEGGREIKRTCYVVVSSNRGLAGSYNVNVIKAAEREIEAGLPLGKEKPFFVCIGSKGSGYFAKRGYEIVAKYLSSPESATFIDTKELMEPVFKLYDEGKVDEVVVVYTTFKSTMEQKAVAKRLLPFEPKQIGESEGKKTKKLPEYEPSAAEVFNYLVPKYAEISLFKTLIEAAACEHAARRIAMQNATDNAYEMIDTLYQSFNRARQAAITSEITEIVSGSDAIKNA